MGMTCCCSLFCGTNNVGKNVQPPEEPDQLPTQKSDIPLTPLKLFPKCR